MTTKNESDALFISLLVGWYSGLCAGASKAFLTQKTKNWSSPSWAPTDSIVSYWPTVVESCNNLLKISVTTDFTAMTKATVEFNDVLVEWNTRIRNYIKRPGCKLYFMLGPATISELMVPYGASYWAKQEYRFNFEYNLTTILGDFANAIGIINTTETIPTDLSYFVGLVSQSLYSGVIKTTPLDSVRYPLQHSLKILKEFFEATPQTIIGVYQQASMIKTTDELLYWQNRKFKDLAGPIPIPPDPTEFYYNKNIISSAEFADNILVDFVFSEQDKAIMESVKGDAIVNNTRESRLRAELPMEFNWLQGKDEIKLDNPSDQGFCASCYAQVVAGMIDYRVAGIVKDNNLPLLDLVTLPDGRKRRNFRTKVTAQTFISCTENGICNGGTVPRCIQYIFDNESTTSQCWPYTSWKTFRSGPCFRPGTCPIGPDNTRGNRFTILNSGVENENISDPEEKILSMKRLLLEGPFIFVMNCPSTFMNYTEGAIYTSAGAPIVEGAHSNHFMLAFGWGVEDGQEFLLALNSWGAAYKTFTFMGMTFNDESDGLGPWIKVSLRDAGLGILKYPIFWATPGLVVDGKKVSIMNPDGTTNWK